MQYSGLSQRAVIRRINSYLQHDGCTAYQEERVPPVMTGQTYNPC